MNLIQIFNQMKNPSNQSSQITNKVKAMTFGKNEEQQKQMFYNMCKEHGLNPDNLIEQANKMGFK